jgi:hypothetical protein
MFVSPLQSSHHSLRTHSLRFLALAAFLAQHLTFSPPPDAESKAADLRRGVREVFDMLESKSPWVDLSALPLANHFGAPKGFDPSAPLLWTAQVEALWQELAVEPNGNTVRAQIIAGPTGMGKTHIAILLALRSFAAGSPVLYIPDAGELFSDVAHGNLLPRIIAGFMELNADILSSCLVQVGSWRSFLEWLSSVKAVIIVDEHGHAYNKIKAARQDPSRIFPLLMPNSYIGARHVRLVFAGSNQAAFELDLNGTYHPTLRFIGPLSVDDAKQFHTSLKPIRSHDLKVYKKFTNLVPRQMVHLASFETPALYVEETRAKLYTDLWANLEAHRTNPLLLDTLNRFFRVSSMALGITNLSFLDLGLVYRQKELGQGTIASPLCLPATLALLDVWRTISPDPVQRLATIKLGEDFEMLMWDVLLGRGFGSDFFLDGLVLGYNEDEKGQTEVQRLPFRFSKFFISSIVAPNKGAGQALLRKEIKHLQTEAKDYGFTTFYQCPDCCKGIDFVIFQPNGEDYPIQVSLSSLTAHSKDNKEPKISELRSLGFAVTRFLYLTTACKPHSDIVKFVNELNFDEDDRRAGYQTSTLAKYRRWKPVVPVLLLVDASRLVGI